VLNGCDRRTKGVDRTMLEGKAMGRISDGDRRSEDQIKRKVRGKAGRQHEMMR